MKSLDPFDPFAKEMPEEALDAYLHVCREIYLEMLRTGEWPWQSDSSNPEDLIESEDNP